MPPDHPLIDRLRRTNAERGLMLPGDRVLVAVSGGPDSLALLHALHCLHEQLGLELVAAHLNHRMRGQQGEDDALFVRDIAAAWGLPAEVESRDVPALARRAGLSLEEAGREARYRFFGRAARRTACATIATAHTADDRAETVLLHLFRGTGLDGLAGFPARRPLRLGHPQPLVVRPLIDVTRAEVLDYCAAQGLSPRLDVTNESPAFLRNRLRRELFPLLEAQYSPALRRHLLRLAQLAEEETALLDAHARALLQAATLGTPPPSRTPTLTLTRLSGTLHLSRATLTSAPPALARRALRLAVQSLCPGPPPELATVERLLSLVRGERPGFTLPGGSTTVHISADELIFEPVASRAPFQVSEPVPLAVPGVTCVPWSTGKIRASLLSNRTKNGEPALAPFTLLPIPSREALIDSASLSGPLAIRPPRPGDRIQPLGMTGHRKLQNLLTDRKVPRLARRRVPLICDSERVVWVVGHCLSEAVKVTPETREAVRLEWEEEE